MLGHIKLRQAGFIGRMAEHITTTLESSPRRRPGPNLHYLFRQNCHWIPAFAGMTIDLCHIYLPPERSTVSCSA